MATQLQLRKGTTSDNDSFIGAEGELTYDTGTKGLRIHDGIKQGGNLIDTIVDFQLPTAENNYTWYRLYSSGWVEQGGIVSASSEQTLVISLPQTMSDANYHITSSTIGFGDNYVNTQANTFELTVFNQTQTGFSMHIGSATNRNKRSWEVKGLAA